MKKNVLKSALFMLAMMAVPAHAMAQDAQPAAAAQDVPKPTAVLDYSQLPEPMAFAKAQYKEALRLNGLKAGDSRDAQIKGLVDALVDYDKLAERSMGKRWPSIEASKQKEFKALFRELLELTYLKRLSDKSFKDDYKVEWDRVVKTKTSATVSCFTRQKDVETEIETVLHSVDGHWEVYDMLLDGASITKTYQKKYDKKIGEKGIDGILDDMREEIANLKKK